MRHGHEKLIHPNLKNTNRVLIKSSLIVSMIKDALSNHLLLFTLMNFSGIAFKSWMYPLKVSVECSITRMHSPFALSIQKSKHLSKCYCLCCCRTVRWIGTPFLITPRVVGWAKRWARRRLLEWECTLWLRVQACLCCVRGRVAHDWVCRFADRVCISGWGGWVVRRCIGRAWMWCGFVYPAFFRVGKVAFLWMKRSGNYI